MILTRDDMFRYLDDLAAFGHDVHDESSEILAMMFSYHHGHPSDDSMNVVLDRYVLLVNEWKSQRPVGCT